MMRRTPFLIAAILLPMLAMAQDWTEQTIADNFDGAFSVYSADMDGDGDMDVLGAAYQSNDITWWENLDGTGQNWSAHTVDGEFSGAQSVFAADVDGDGDMDVLGAAYGIRDITLWRNLDGTGLNWSERMVDPEFDGASSVYSTDMDGDGDMDVLGSAYLDDKISWWENTNGSGLNWSEHTLDSAFDGANSVYAADVDGDGDMDVLGAASYANDIIWWENLDGIGHNWSEHMVDDMFGSARCVFAADVDGDGDMDVLGAAQFADEITWWENLNGNGLSWSEHTVDGAFNGAFSVYAADIDVDGDMDVIGASQFGDDITWWENTDGSGLNWSEHILDSRFDGAHGVYVEDVNGDGDMDILGAAFNDDKITVWFQPHEQLAVVSPNGGEAWRINTIHNIEWVSSSGEDVIIELLDGAFVERVITEGTENNGVFEWTVPEDIDPGDNYRVRCILADNSEQDISDEAFAITSLPTLSITPHHPPITISADGDGFWYWVEITNLSPLPGTRQYWTEVILPNGYTFGPLSINTLTLDPWGIYAPAEPLPQWVPAYAPAGMYEYVMHLGVYPNIIITSDSFEFEKLPGLNMATLPESAWSVEDWHNEAWEQSGVTGSGNEAQPLPTAYGISSAYPNPFNPTTNVTISLPQASQLNVTVFNIAGQLVAVLANGSYASGQFTLTFDASGMGAGLYFIRAVVPGQMDEMQKVILLK